MEILAFDHVSFTYPGAGEPALRDVSFSVERGSFTVLCGLSGCGKTTLLRLLKPSVAFHGHCSGEITLLGRPAKALSPAEEARGIGFVGQDPEAGLVTDTVGHELSFGLESLGEDPAAIRRRTAESAVFFGLHQSFDTPVHTLSGGQKQLLALAAAMVLSPQVLLLDEPTSQLDPVAAAGFISMLQKINRELGTTILLSEHRLEEAFPAADRVLVIDHGRLAADGTPGEAALQAAGLPIAAGFPAAVRIYSALEGSGRAPVTVREGRDYLETRFLPLPVEEPAAQPPTGAVAAELRDVWFRYEKDAPDVLRGLRFTLRAGELHCLLGANGGGKSTCLRVILGQCRPYLGSVRVLGNRGKGAPAGVAYLPQDPKLLFTHTTLREELEESARPGGPGIEDIAGRLGIGHLLGRHPFDLSGGEQQRAALAKLLLLSPKVLLLDEPTKGLDAAAKQTLARLLKELTDAGAAVLAVTHDVEFAAMYAHRCSLFFGGEEIACQPPRQFFAGSEFYTTAANRMARALYPAAVTCGDVVDCCRRAGRKA